MAIITSPVTGVSAEVFNVEQVMGLLYKDAEQIIIGADITLKYPELERTVSEWGAILSTIRIPAASSKAVDPNTTALCGPDYVTPQARYFQDWTEKVYSVEYRRIDVTKVLRGEMEYADLLAQLINSLIEGYRMETNTAIRQAFLFASQNSEIDDPATLLHYDEEVGVIDGGFLTQQGNPENVDYYEQLATDWSLGQAATWSDVFAEIQRIAKDMTYENTTYTEGTTPYGARWDDLVIYVNSDFIANADVRYMAQLYNMAEARKIPEIRETDGLVFQASSDQKAYGILIMDKRALSHVERYRELSGPYPVECRKSMRVDLHVEDMVAFNHLYKAYMILTYLPTQQ